MTPYRDLKVRDALAEEYARLKRKAEALEFQVEDLQGQNEVLRATLREVGIPNMGEVADHAA